MFDSTEYANSFAFKSARNFAVPMQKSLPKMYNYIFDIYNKNKKTANYDNPDLFTKLVVKSFATKKFIKRVQKSRPDLIINTHILGSGQISYMKKRKLYDMPQISIITDHVHHNSFFAYQKYVDYYIVPDFNIKRKTVDAGITDKKILDYGIPISTKVTPKTKTSDFKLKILFFGGGGVGFESSLPYLKALQYNNEWTIKFVSGKNKKLYRKARRIASSNTEIMGYSNDVPKLLEWADLVVSKAGGITTTECINSNTPLISILSFGGHEKGNVDYTLSNNTGIWCDSPENLKSTIEQLVTKRDRIIIMQNNCSKIAERNSVKKIVKLALDIISK